MKVKKHEKEAKREMKHEEAEIKMHQKFGKKDV